MRIDSPKVVTLTVADSPYTASATPGAPELLLLVNATGGAVTINMPTAIGNVTKYIVQKTDSTANAVTLDGNGTQTINGALTSAITTQYAALVLVSNNTNWLITANPLATSGGAGQNAYSTTSASFTQPAASATVSVSVDATAWMGVGQYLYIVGGGYYTVSSITDSTTVVLMNLGYTGNAAVAATVATAAKVSPGGIQGAGSSLPVDFGTFGRVQRVYINYNTNALLYDGFAAFTTTGTLTARTPSTSSAVTSKMRIGVVSASTAGSIAEIRQTTQVYIRGGALNVGGFRVSFSFTISDVSLGATSRMFCGLLSSGTAALSATVNFATFNTPCFGIGHDSGDTALSIYGASSFGVTKTSLGASFPVSGASADGYACELYCLPNGSSLTYTVTRINTGVTVTGSLVAADHLSATDLLALRMFRSNGTTASSVGLDIMNITVRTLY